MKSFSILLSALASFAPASANASGGTPANSGDQLAVASSKIPVQLEGSMQSQGEAAKMSRPDSAGIEIPEPSNIFMLALGVVGLVAGRYAAKRRRNH